MDLLKVDIEGMDFKLIPKKQKRGPGFTCIFCDKYFSGTSSNPNDHIRRHIHEKPFNCEICDFTAAAATDVTTHVNRFHGPKCIPCMEPDCEKMFKSEYALRIHVNRHHIKGGECPWKCDICGKTFRQKGTLQSHSRLHTGEKPFKCHVCNRDFTQKSTLNTHLRVHTGEKRFECETCNKRYGTKQYLLKHQEKGPCSAAAKEQYQKCNICGAQFWGMQQLEQHQKLIHGSVPPKQIVERTQVGGVTNTIVRVNPRQKKYYTIQVIHHDS